jgi:hypothetical protein
MHWQQFLHFFSDNNSCIRKKIFERIPFRIVKYGEDQLWASDIIRAGYEKVYVPTAIVKHSHEYTPEQVYERSIIDADFFKYHWGYEIINKNSIDDIINNFIKHDNIAGFENFLPDQEIQNRIAIINARFAGYAEGLSKKISLFDPENTEKSKF